MFIPNCFSENLLLWVWIFQKNIQADLLIAQERTLKTLYWWAGQVLCFTKKWWNSESSYTKKTPVWQWANDRELCDVNTWVKRIAFVPSLMSLLLSDFFFFCLCVWKIQLMFQCISVVSLPCWKNSLLGRARAQSPGANPQFIHLYSKSYWILITELKYSFKEFVLLLSTEENIALFAPMHLFDILSH